MVKNGQIWSSMHKKALISKKRLDIEKIGEIRYGGLLPRFFEFAKILPKRFWPGSKPLTMPKA